MATRSQQLDWQEIHLSEDEASAQGTHAVRFLVQQVEKAQNNSLLRPMLNNLMRAHGLQLLNYEPPTQDPTFQEVLNEGTTREEREDYSQDDASSGRSRSPSRRTIRPLKREDNSLKNKVQKSGSKRRRSPSREVSSSPSPRGRKRERERHARRCQKFKRTPSPSSSPSKRSSFSFSSSSDGYSSSGHHKRRRPDTHRTWKRSRKLQKFKEGGKSITFQTYDGSYGATDKVLSFIQQYCAGLTEDIRAYVNDQKPRTIAEVIHRSKVAMIFFFPISKRAPKPFERNGKVHGREQVSKDSKGNGNKGKKDKGGFVMVLCRATGFGLWRATCMVRLKATARLKADKGVPLRGRQRNKEEMRQKVMEVSATISVGGGDIDVALLGLIQEFLEKETLTGICSIERGGSLLHLHLQMVVRLWSNSLVVMNRMVKSVLMDEDIQPQDNSQSFDVDGGKDMQLDRLRIIIFHF
ncbi:hypothetical protein L7F22_000022 [Adiantum nelumboides]|nr:hypothetical protein [Adiantum nelumboides]